MTSSAPRHGRNPPSDWGVCRLGLRGGSGDGESGSTTARGPKGCCHVSHPATSRHHLLPTHLRSQLGRIPWQSFFAPGVLVAALIVVALTEGLAGLKAMGSRLIRWRVSWIWYALALAVPLAVKFASIGLTSALGAPVPEIAEFNVWYSLPMAIAINIINPINAQLPEESSFRGWAQPKLQTTRTPLAATVLMAVGVTIWHIPLFVMPQFGSSPIEALATVAVTFWYAWLFNHASGSSLLTLIAHATEGTIETSTLWQDTADMTLMMWLYGLLWCAVALGSAGVRPPVLDQAASVVDQDSRSATPVGVGWALEPTLTS